jgi:hypothetical protein
MTDVEPTMKIWIIRRGSGKRQVHPSPIRVMPGEPIRIKNWTSQTATVRFQPALYTPGAKGLRGKAKQTLVRPKSTLQIRPGGYADVTLTAPGFYEYDVTFPGQRYAEGNSKPGVIVDP